MFRDSKNVDKNAVDLNLYSNIEYLVMSGKGKSMKMKKCSW